MLEFNNITYELTDGEKFALICGMLAGMKLQDKTQPPSQVEVVLEPIGVNGHGHIGMLAEDIEYKGINKIRIPVVTHDVDREYSGFSLSVSYDSSRITVQSITEGDLGPLQYTDINSGKAFAYTMLDKGQFKKEPCILCWLDCLIIKPPTLGNPIELKFNNSSGYDPNYCTLLTWVLNDIDGEYYSYFITPTINKGCNITSEEVEESESNLGQEQQIATLASPSLIALGTSYIEPGGIGLVPIYTNSSEDDEFEYNQFKLRVVIDRAWLDVLAPQAVIGIDGWGIKAEMNEDDNDNIVIDIFGYRNEPIKGNDTVGYISFFLSKTAVSISCKVENTLSKLIGPTGELSVVQGDGFLIYPIPEGGSLSGIGGGGSYGWGNGLGIGGGSGGGMSGSGKIWSSTEQDIWIDLGNGNKYPVHLMPGDNDVHVWIPNIVPKDTWEETQVTIIAPGYILIPGGFTWQTIIKPEASDLIGLSSPRITERFEIKDLYDVEIITSEPPVDLDNLIDRIILEDNVVLDSLTVKLLYEKFIDTFEMNDILEAELESKEPDGERDRIENVNIEDSIKYTLVNLSILNEPQNEQLGIEDVSEITTLRVIISNQSNIESTIFEDIFDVELV